VSAQQDENQQLVSVILKQGSPAPPKLRPGRAKAGSPGRGALSEKQAQESLFSFAQKKFRLGQNATGAVKKTRRKLDNFI